MIGRKGSLAGGGVSPRQTVCEALHSISGPIALQAGVTPADSMS